MLPKYWGKGYATEIGAALVQYAFHDLKWNKIYATTHLGHHASLHVLEKCGLHLVGTVPYSIGADVNLLEMENPYKISTNPRFTTLSGYTPRERG